MELGLVGQAAGMFAVTNLDDILILALFFGQAAGRRGDAARVVAGSVSGSPRSSPRRSSVRSASACCRTR